VPLLLQGLGQSGTHPSATHDDDVHGAYPALLVRRLTCVNVVLITFSRFAGQRARAGRGPLGNIMPGNGLNDPSRYGSWTRACLSPTVTVPSDRPTGASAGALSGG